MKILTLDIETTPHTTYTWGLHNQFIGINQIESPSEFLCFAAKWHHHKQVIFSRDLGDIYNLLEAADVAITWNGDSFDIPILNREFLMAGLIEPAPFISVDLIKPVRKRYRFASNKLDYVAQQLGVGAKVKHPGFQLWLDCMADDPKAWKIMERYNKGDVIITEKIFDKVRPWITNFPNVLLIEQDQSDDGLRIPPGCPTCGSLKIQKRGTAYTAVSAYQRYQCTKCGHWLRGTTRMRGSSVR